MRNCQPRSAIASACLANPVRMLLGGAALAGLLAAALPVPAEAAAGPARGVSARDKSGIEREIFAYFRDFGQGDVDAILTHYADDAVFLPDGLPTVAGKANLRAAYVETLKYVRVLPGGQSVAEDAFVTGEFAWVRTDSRAEVLNPATGQKSRNHFREVFLLRKTDGQWKIWRYMFNTIEPAPQEAAAR